MPENHADDRSANTRPIWIETSVLPAQPALDERRGIQCSVDVCIIGAGLAGLTAATRLKQEGKTVAVVELGRVGMGETAHTTAHLTEVFDLDYRDLISRFGIEGAQIAASSIRRGIDWMESTSHELGIASDFRRVPGYQFTEKTSELADLRAEADAALRVGVPNEMVTESPLPFAIQGAIRFSRQAQFSPLAYAHGLARTIPGGGSFLFENTRMLDIQEGEPCHILTDQGTIFAEDVFVAAHVPSSNRFVLQSKIAAYRTYAIAARLVEPLPSAALFWDIDEPYHYLRTFDWNGSTYLIAGGEDHKTGTGRHMEDHFAKLEEWAEQRFEIETVRGVTHRWSGQIIEPVDGLPYIGRNPLSDHIYVATGFSGNGMGFGSMAGLLTADLILHHENAWSDLYDPGRVKPLASIKSFLSENIDFPSHLISDRITPAETGNTATVREGEGAIVSVGGKKVAAYRDPSGELHFLSPVCPHLGCHVHWNGAEKSWDCPCHGSRFNPIGQLLNGPAVNDLASEEIDENVPLIPERYDQPSSLFEPLGGSILSVFSCPVDCRGKV